MVGMAPALGVSQTACNSSRSFVSRSAPHGLSLASRPQRAISRKSALRVRASEKVEECNEEECAPVKEVGKLSLSWEAEERTKVAGTFPPMARQERKWTGFVEKDTAGQTNIYSVEPTMYVADSAISSNTAGSSAEGTQNNLAVAGFLSLVAVAGASAVLISVTKNSPVTVEAEVGYSGPTLSYYIAKFTPEPAPLPAIVGAAVQAAPEVSSSPEIAVEETSTSAAPESVEAVAPVESSV